MTKNFVCDLFFSEIESLMVLVNKKVLCVNLEVGVIVKLILELSHIIVKFSGQYSCQKSNYIYMYINRRFISYSS